MWWAYASDVNIFADSLDVPTKGGCQVLTEVVMERATLREGIMTLSPVNMTVGDINIFFSYKIYSETGI